MHSLRLFVFDWDGTLCDSTGTIVLAIQRAASELGLPSLQSSECRQIIGLALEPALHTLYPSLGASELAALCSAYRRHYDQLNLVGVELFPSVRETLDALKHRGYYLAVATSKTRRGLNKVMAQVQVEGLFDVTRCADESESKPSPVMLQQLLRYLDVKPQQAVMVGDTDYDLRMANHAGIHAIGVDFGAHDVERLQACRPLTIISRLDELLSFAE